MQPPPGGSQQFLCCVWECVVMMASVAASRTVRVALVSPVCSTHQAGHKLINNQVLGQYVNWLIANVRSTTSFCWYYAVLILIDTDVRSVSMCQQCPCSPVGRSRSRSVMAVVWWPVSVSGQGGTWQGGTRTRRTTTVTSVRSRCRVAGRAHRGVTSVHIFSSHVSTSP